MPKFAYEALTASGQVEKATMVATSEGDLEERLREKGSYLIKSRPAEKEAVAKKTDGKVDRKDLLSLLEYIAGSAHVGMPIMTTLSDVEFRLESKRLRTIVAEMRDTMSLEGKSLSEAMAEHPKAFPVYYVSSIQAGEASGQLDYVLKQLVEHLDWQESVSSQLRQALTYPIVIIVAVTLLLVIVVGFVFPRLIPTLSGRGGPVPLPTRIIIATSNFVRNFWWVTLLAAGGLVAAFTYIRRTPRGGLAIDRYLLKLPGVGQLILQNSMARMVTYMGLFYKSGVELLYSLTLVEKMTGNRAVAAAVADARDAIAGGDSISTAFGRSPLFPPIVLRALALGESTGHLDEALSRVQEYFTREVPAAVRRMITILQPVMIAVMGGAVLLVALAIYLPILGIYESIGRR
ncbi:MAG TPA: type II secretion system F family protein [Gemmatimonadaceae bacterium]|nr:type II secretion system F family protein [Gemmatimonadaceae bacterium]